MESLGSLGCHPGFEERNIHLASIACTPTTLVVTTSPQHFTVVITSIGEKVPQFPRPGRLRCNT